MIRLRLLVLMLKAFAIDVHLIEACLHNISDVEIYDCLADLGITDEEKIVTPTGRLFERKFWCQLSETALSSVLAVNHKNKHKLC